MLFVICMSHSFLRSKKSNIHNESYYYSEDKTQIFAATTSKKNLVTVNGNGCIRLWETSFASLEDSLAKWKNLIGNGDENIQLTKERYSGSDVKNPKHGKVDPKNEPHIGGNTWAGGTGGMIHFSNI